METVAALVFQQHLQQDAGFVEMGLAVVAARADDMHPHLARRVSAKHAAVLNEHRFRAMAGGGHSGAYAA